MESFKEQPRGKGRSHLNIIFFTLIFLLGAGCVQTRISEPKRTGVEQLLLSTAVDRALTQIDFSSIANRRVFLDGTYFESYDREYALGSIRDRLSANGARLTTNWANADVIVEARCGALSTDSSTSLIGLPSTPIPIPLAGAINTPELYLLKTQKQYSVAKFALLAYEQDSGKHLKSSGPAVGESHHHYYSVLGFFKFTTTGIPEKKSARARKSNEEKSRPISK